MVEFLLTPMADAFMQVGVFVAALGAVFVWLRWKHGDWLATTLHARGRLGPLAGALLGVSPGCAGALLVMPLYARGKVSFGTVVAALASTMGDSSWIIIAADPAAALGVHAVLFGTGLAMGYLVDALGIAPRSRAAAELVPAGPVRPRREGPGAALDSALAAPTGLATPAGLGRLGGALWLAAAAAAVVALPVTFQVVRTDELATLLGGFDPYLVLGATGTALAMVMAVMGAYRRRGGAAPTCHGGRPASLAAAMRDGAHEIAAVVVWVTGAYLAWQLVQSISGFDGSQLAFAGVLGVLAGALVGLVPGCAAQIMFTGLYVAGALPMPALLANAVSQDGDALLPLLALDRRAAVVAGAVTTLPAVLVGGAALLVF
jgi:hypothetical protein